MTGILIGVALRHRYGVVRVGEREARGEWVTWDEHEQNAVKALDSTLNMPYGIAAHGAILVCADTANSRLLGFHADDLMRR